MKFKIYKLLNKFKQINSRKSRNTRREKYSKVLQTHIVIVGQVHILVFLFRYSYSQYEDGYMTLYQSLGKITYSHLSYNHYMCLENVTVFFSPCKIKK